MARARSIKPRFFVNEELCDLPPLTRLLFIGLWTVADRAGRLEDRPKRLKMEVLPADNCDIPAMLDALESRGFIRRYAVRGLRLIQIAKWDKHQNPHHTEKASILPPEPKPDNIAETTRAATNVAENAEAESPDPAPNQDEQELTVNARKSDGKNPADTLIPDTLIPYTLTPDTPTPETLASAKNADVQSVFLFWRDTMRKPRAALDDKRRKLIRAALAMGYDVDDLCKAVRGCSKSGFHMGQNQNGTAYNGLDLILRNAEKIDSFIAMDDAPPALNRTQTLSEQRAATYAALTGKTDNGHDDPFTIDA